MSQWQSQLLHTLEQLPLIDRRATGMDSVRGSQPETVFVGIGVCAPSGVSRALPIDVLALLLPAERVRRATGADNLVILVADYHAKQVGMPGDQVDAYTTTVLDKLRGIRDVLGLSWTIGRASKLAELDAYRDAIYRLGRGRANLPYSLLQAVDYQVIEDLLGPVIKVGWTIGRDGDPFSRRDEVGFDRRTAALLGRKLRAVYCRPGRALVDRAPRSTPYVTLSPATRICLDPTEDVRAKLAAAECRSDTRNGYRRLLKQVTRELGRYGVTTRGDVATRCQHAIDQLTATRSASGGADELKRLVQRGGGVWTVGLSQSV